MIHNASRRRLVKERRRDMEEQEVAILESGLRFVQVPASREEESLAYAVTVGLAHAQKTLPSRFFYDVAGSRLFERITRLPEYYLTRCETEILQRSSREILIQA